MSAEALKPKLTRYDKRVLRGVPYWWNTTDRRCEAIDAWRLGYELRIEDVPDLLRTLRGLEQMGYVTSYQHGFSPRGYLCWSRTDAGNEALGIAGGSVSGGQP